MGIKKFRSWIKSHQIFTYFEDGIYSGNMFDWSTAEQCFQIEKKEFYEGDIVSEPDVGSPNGELISEIVFDRLAYYTKKGDMRGSLLHTALYGKVIGHIHKDRHLLKED